MHYLNSLPFLIAAATFTLADTTAKATTLADNAVNTTCASENSSRARILTIQPSSILRQCIQSLRPNLGNCAPDDWDCRCTNSMNVVECYTNCPEDPSKNDAETTRQRNCANAKAHALISVAASTVSSSRAAATSTDIDDGTDISDSEVENDFEGGDSIKSYSGLEANLFARPEEGAASGLRIGGWLGFLGLTLGFLF
ncbi:hypothetical protein N7519_000227 [Penicillium mononematosum]|uniref:uncharacterized protein n=1 Tax=Penicillium mononematosum TaxID=268346 RepID=UPI0025466AE5|nr:uncharacterized protein N7519_000227 [Penicillium mononematosum]KAJ6190206.1 hypothetical protein N7519_000227 [Penicillium mononematosum]